MQRAKITGKTIKISISINLSSRDWVSLWLVQSYPTHATGGLHSNFGCCTFNCHAFPNRNSMPKPNALCQTPRNPRPKTILRSVCMVSLPMTHARHHSFLLVQQRIPSERCAEEVVRSGRAVRKRFGRAVQIQSWERQESAWRERQDG